MAWHTIGTPDILERTQGSPGYEYRLVVKAKPEKLNQASKQGFQFVRLRYFHKGDVYWQEHAVLERPLNRSQTVETLRLAPIAEYAVTRTFHESTMQHNIEKLAAAGYCVVHLTQPSYEVVLEKKNVGPSCTYEFLEWKEMVPKQKHPWYLARPRSDEIQSYGAYLEQGLNKLGARAFRYSGVSLDLGAHPFLERYAILSQHFEYRVIEIAK